MESFFGIPLPAHEEFLKCTTCESAVECRPEPLEQRHFMEWWEYKGNCEKTNEAISACYLCKVTFPQPFTHEDRGAHERSYTHQDLLVEAWDPSRLGLPVRPLPKRKKRKTIAPTTQPPDLPPAPAAEPSPNTTEFQEDKDKTKIDLAKRGQSPPTTE